MNMQQMVQNMQKMQRQYEKAHKVLEETEFTYTQNGVVKITVKGDMSLVGIEFVDASALEADNKEMLEEMISIAYENVRQQVLDAEDALADKFKVGGAFGL